MKWYQKAAAKGNGKAMIEIGQHYDAGQGVSPDHDEAVKWYHRAWETGDPEVRDTIVRSHLLSERQGPSPSK